jgi:D-serine deaminase-like pyridoxal phosphate-dependent protein
MKMVQQKEDWFIIKNFADIDTPCLVVYPSRVSQNIRTFTKMAGDVLRLRPHVKTHKCAEVVRMMLAAGVHKFKCATITEAEMLGMVGAPDVLLAYQPVGPKVERLIRLIQGYPGTRYSCLTDDLTTAECMAKQFTLHDLEVDVYIDLNSGMSRTGISVGPEALKFYLTVFGLRGLNLKGLHTYDGHIRSNNADLRSAQCDEAFDKVKVLYDLIVAHGLPAPIIIAGGSPTFPFHVKRAEVECSPGTFVYWDGVYSEMCPEQEFVPAALLLCRVISLPDSTKICVDLGHKSVAAESELGKRINFLNARELVPIAQNEEHLVLEVVQGHHYQIGNIFYGLPWHICPTVALYERAISIENGIVTGEWKTIARDRKINY